MAKAGRARQTKNAVHPAGGLIFSAFSPCANAAKGFNTAKSNDLMH
jgi:hypothetical protein